MASTISLMPVYTGTLPDKDTQAQNVFDAAADTWIAYEYSTYVPAFNTIATQLNAYSVATESNLISAAAYASTTTTQAANAAASASLAESTALSLATSVTQVNAILGVGYGEGYIDSNGDLIMPYDDGVVTTEPYFNALGEFIVEY